MQLYAAIYSYMQLYTTIYSYVQLYAAMCNYIPPPTPTSHREGMAYSWQAGRPVSPAPQAKLRSRQPTSCSCNQDAKHSRRRADYPQVERRLRPCPPPHGSRYWHAGNEFHRPPAACSSLSRMGTPSLSRACSFGWGLPAVRLSPRSSSHPLLSRPPYRSPIVRWVLLTGGLTAARAPPYGLIYVHFLGWRW